jgi:PAS domain S-box-containing protein
LFISGKWRGRTRAFVLSVAIGGGGLFAAYLITSVSSTPGRPLRIGFEQNLPVQIRTSTGFSGLAVETVNEAAKRAGIHLLWVDTGTSSDEAFQKGLVDLWPLMANMPDRRKRLHLSRPWLHSDHVLVLRAKTPVPAQDFAGPIAVVKMPLHVRLARELYPNAQLDQLPSSEEVIRQVCRGTIIGGFLEGRAASSALQNEPAACANVPLRLRGLAGETIDSSIASTFEYAKAADALRREIGGMFRDGTLAVLLAKYSYYGLDDAWPTYDLLEAAERARWAAWSIGGLACVLLLVVWRATTLHQRKRSYTALRESEERFRKIFEEGPLGVALVARDYRFLKVNSALCRMLGYSEDELCQMSFIDITHADDLGVDVQLGEKLFKREIPFYQLQKRYVKKNDEIIWINLHASVIRDQDGKVLYGLAMIEDITEAKHTQEKTIARQKLEGLGALAAGIAHDFNNLLGGILAEAELTEAALPDIVTALDEIQRIKQSAIRGAEIVRELMVYAGQDLITTREPVDISVLVREMLNLLQVSISKHTTLAVDLTDSLPTVCGNPAQIRQVVMNLVINASEAIGKNEGVIAIKTSHVAGCESLVSNSVQTSSADGFVQLEITDTGCGIAESIKMKMFDPFFSTKFLGRGLGLAVVQGIVRDHAGSIDVTSAPGAGATFKVFLPCTLKKVDLRNVGLRSNIDRNTLRTGTLLVVDDEEMLRSAVSKALGKNGFSVIEATNGSAAMNLLSAHAHEIDTVLLDVTLPGVASRDVFEQAQKMRPDLRVVVTSAYSKEAVDASFGGLKIEHFIRKPYELAELKKLLAEVGSI